MGFNHSYLKTAVKPYVSVANIYGDSLFTRFYMNKKGTTGTREWLAFGYLDFGSASGGLSYLSGYGGLGIAYWDILARLSFSGSRGEWSA